MTDRALDAPDTGGPLDPDAALTGPDRATTSTAIDDDPGDREEASAQDGADADDSRPTLPDETADGLDDMDEEVRHQAEDLPLDTPGRLR